MTPLSFIPTPLVFSLCLAKLKQVLKTTFTYILFHTTLDTTLHTTLDFPNCSSNISALLNNRFEVFDNL